mgnify:CR=1 FL=1
MAETANYRLYLTDSSSERFIDWREKISGQNDSNMQKIDTVLGNKADKSTSIDCVLLANGWDENGRQTIQIDGLKESTNGMIGLSKDISEEQLLAVCEAVFYISGQSDGSLTISAGGVIPSVDIPALVVIWG